MVKKNTVKKVVPTKTNSKMVKLGKVEGEPETFDDFLNTLSEEEDESSGDEGDDDEEVELQAEPNGKDYFTREEDTDIESIQEETASTFKKSLAALQETDPDFFAYLKENDEELLNFDGSDDDESDDEAGEEDEGSDTGHEPPSQLEVASDSEADSEEELNEDKESEEYKRKLETSLSGRNVNFAVISYWEDKLSNTRDLNIFSQVVEAFESAVEIILQDKGVQDKSKKNNKERPSLAISWKVIGSHNFNALIRLCIRSVFSWCVRYLGASNNQEFCIKAFTKSPYEMKEKNAGRWTKLRPKLRTYMNAVVVFLNSMGNPDAITSVLRHCQTMSGFWSLMASKSFKLLRLLISVWSTGEDTNRVAAFITILRMANYNKDVFLTRIFKQMYISFVSNSKFTSANSWPAINFMRASLVEIYLLDTSLAYTIAFPFIRQLAIHLRNATTAGNTQKSGGKSQKKGSRSGGADSAGFGKKEASRIVYSWQFLHSLHLWAHLLNESVNKGDNNLQLLMHPVVQVCLGTIKLIPTRRYIPLRFHIIKMLIDVQDKAKVFIPVLPLATEVLNLTDFSHKNAAKFSVRPLNFQCCLKADANETGYFKAVADGIFEAILGACKVIGTELAFPEIVTPTLVQLRSFIKKKCKNGEVARKFKTLVEKIDANSTYIKQKRAKAMESGLISLADEKSQQILRLEIENSNPPILTFAKDYFKTTNNLNAKLHLKKSAKKDFTREENLIPKHSETKQEPVGKKVKKKLDKMEGNVLFAKDEDSEEEDESTKLDAGITGKKVPKRKHKHGKHEPEEAEDDEGQKPKKKRKNSLKKNKNPSTKASSKQESEADDLQDELMDFNFHDLENEEDSE